MKDSSGDKRKIYLDILRIIAIFLVIFNHTGTQGFFLFSVTPVTVEYWVYLSMSIFCKIAVPLFFMISGALLIGKDDTFRILRWRISRFILVILGASFFWYVILVRNHIEPFSIYSFFRRVYSNDVIVPYWFLYSYFIYIIDASTNKKNGPKHERKGLHVFDYHVYHFFYVNTSFPILCI